MENQLPLFIGVIAGFILIALATLAWRRDLGGIRTKLAASIPGATERIEAGLVAARTFWTKYGWQLVGIFLKAAKASQLEQAERPAPDELTTDPVEVVDHEPEK